MKTPARMAPSPGAEYTVRCALARAVSDPAHLAALRDAVVRVRDVAERVVPYGGPVHVKKKDCEASCASPCLTVAACQSRTDSGTASSQLNRPATVRD